MIFRVLGALAVGVLASYYFDPASGRRRRALLRDKLVHARHEVGDYAEGTAQDLRNRARGLVAEARGMMERRRGQRRQEGSQVHIDPSEPQP